ncbi:hypothetical protein EIP86_008881 [Pleurotus ostreatoroseus]|nr:hypothetical protein EIP86_008881 [Pleurotus ostreatoroseus]
MSTIAIFALLAATAVAAQRVHLLSPASGDSLSTTGPLNVTLHQDESTSSLTQLATYITLTPCPSDGCPADPGLLPAGTVINNQAIDPLPDTNDPSQGLISQVFLGVPEDFPLGPAVFSVAHTFALGTLELDFSSIVVNVVQGGPPGEF